jgi:hypothetical protein
MFITLHHGNKLKKVSLERGKVYQKMFDKAGLANKVKLWFTRIRTRFTRSRLIDVNRLMWLQKRIRSRNLTIRPRVVRFARLRRRVKRRIKKAKNGFLRKPRNKPRINAHRSSFFTRFLMRSRVMHSRRKKRTRFTRLFFFNMSQPVPIRDTFYLKEPAWFQRVRSSIRYFERKPFRKYPFRYGRYAKPLYKRQFYMGRILITSRKRNTFMNVEEIVRRQSRMITRTIYKSSCSLVGYTGIKRKTDQARQEVANDIGFFLGEANLTTIDVIFKRRPKSKNARKFMKKFLPAPICVRNIIFKIRRTHGFTRRKKLKRK